MRKISTLILLMTCAVGVYAQSSRSTNQTVRIQPSALKNYVPVSPAAVIFTDNMDTVNSIAGLVARGYATYFRGSGAPGILPEWGQGDPVAYSSYNGPDSGYVGSSYNSVLNSDNLDNWLCLPPQNVALGDSFSFFVSSPLGSIFPDSVRVMFNPTGATLPEDTNWIELDNFKSLNNGTWQRRAYAAPAASATAVFAIRHSVVNAGPLGSNSDYLGVDQIDVFNAIPGTTFDDCTAAVDITSGFGGAIGVVNNMGPYDNTGATTVNDPLLGWQCFGEPDGGAAAPELNNTVWFTFTGDGNSYFVESGNCAGITNYIDDGDTQFALYTGSCGTLTPYKCNEDGPNSTASTYPAGFQFGTTLGTVYYLMVDGFNATAIGGGVSSGEFCIKISQVASVACSSPTVTTGTATQNVLFLCSGDTLNVQTAGAVTPTTGTYYGISWIISSASITGSTDPLNDPSLIATYTFSSPAPQLQ